MDPYTLLKFAHVIGFILLGGGLLAVFVSELQAYRTGDMSAFVEAARYTAVFYDSLAAPGALLVGISGFFLVRELDVGYFTEPWVVGMWSLFLLEFIEGNTVTRLQFRSTLRRSREALSRGVPLNDELRQEARSLVNRVVHFLDIPLFAVIVYCGAVKPDSWTHVIVAIAAAVSVAAALTVLVPRVARRDAPIWP